MKRAKRRKKKVVHGKSLRMSSIDRQIVARLKRIEKKLDRILRDQRWARLSNSKIDRKYGQSLRDYERGRRESLEQWAQWRKTFVMAVMHTLKTAKKRK